MIKVESVELKKMADVLAYFLVVISIFFLPVSTSVNALFIVAAFVAVLGLKFQQHAKQLMTYKTTQWTLALIAVFFIGALFSVAPMHEAWHAFKKYSFRLFAFVVLAPLFCRSKTRYYLFYTVIAASVIYSFIDMLDLYQIISVEALFNKPKHVFLSPLPLSLFSAFSCLLTLFFLSTYTNLKKTFSALLAYQLFYLFFVNEERTAVIVFVVMAFVFLCRKLKFKQKLLMTLPAIALLVIVGFVSPVIKSRVITAANDIKLYQQGEVRSSIGLRAEYLLHSFQLIKKSPVWGFGTGSFAQEYKKTGGPTVEVGDETLGDPHNSYVHIQVQLGVIGLILFLAWLQSQWKFSTRLMSNERILLRCFLLAFMLSCLSESAFYRTRNANLYLTMAMVCMGNVFQPRRKYKRYYKRR